MQKKSSILSHNDDGFISEFNVKISIKCALRIIYTSTFIK